MNSIKRKYINELAETLYNGLQLTPNFDVEEDVVKKLGGSIKHDDSLKSFIDDFDAKINKAKNSDDEEFIITISDSKPYNRIRFSIAHELGHLFLHMKFLDKNLWVNDSNVVSSEYYRFGHSIEESEANEFAAAFLMPENKFKEIAEKCEYDSDRIANEFGVSLQAAEFRGKNLGIKL